MQHTMIRMTHNQHKDDWGSECPHSCCIADPAAKGSKDGKMDSRARLTQVRHTVHADPHMCSNSLGRTAVITETKTKGQSNYRQRDSPAKKVVDNVHFGREDYQNQEN